MNHLIPLLFFLLWGLGGFAQEKLSKQEKERREKNIKAGNPFVKFGCKAPVATLSKGKYLEVHDLDSIVTIGTIRWDVENQKIVGNITIDSLNVDAQPIGDAPGMWMSPDPLSEEFPSYSPYSFCFGNPMKYKDPDGRAAVDVIPPDWVDRNGQIVWDEKVTSATDKDLQKGDVYLGKNVLVGNNNRDTNLNEPINSARFDLYLESDKSGPTASIKGNTIPADVTKYGTLKEGVYPAEAGHRSKYPNEQAILINGGKELPTVNGNPHNPKGKPVEEQTLTGVFFHAGNSGRASLSTNAGKPISEGCQTGPNSSGSKATFKSFMDKVPANFKGSYYLKSKN